MCLQLTLEGRLFACSWPLDIRSSLEPSVLAQTLIDIDDVGLLNRADEVP